MKKISFEKRIVWLALITSTPLLVMLLWVMTYANISIWLILLIAFIGSLSIIYAAQQIYYTLTYQLRSLSNLLGAIVLGDYSLRARSDQGGSVLNELILSINNLSAHLSLHRIESTESQLLLQTVIEHIDVAIVAISDENKIRFMNPAAKKLLQIDQKNSEIALLKQLEVVSSFTSGCQQVVELSLGHQHGRFNVYVEEFRESGLQHKLLFITDVRTLLRSEESKAWQSLVRVISHEINNSLTPIASISQTLSRLLSRQHDAIGIHNQEYNKDLREGLSIITERAKGLSQFVNSYKQLAKLPEPQKSSVSIRNLFHAVSNLFKDQIIQIEPAGDVQLFIDPVQLEQVFINLIKNSLEAMSQTNSQGVVFVSWQLAEPFLKLSIMDQGCGISNLGNLFVPFYSTKKQGSGIGLVLCRQIIEAHHGHLTITNNVGAQGCCVSIELPLSA